MVDGEGDRAITVIGERLTPSLDDDLPWEALSECEGLFVTAADASSVESVPFCCSPGCDPSGSFACASAGQGVPSTP